MSDVHAAVGSYAVDALSPVERADFESHLLDCASCQAEVAEFADSLAELTLLVSAPPPAALRQSVLAAVAGVPQLGPQRASRSSDRAVQADGDGREAAPRRALAPVTELRPTPPHEVAPLEEHPSVVPDTPWLGVAAVLSEDAEHRSRRRGRVLGALVAALLVVALVLGGWVYVARQQVQAQTTEERQEIELLTATDAESHTARADRAAVTYVVSAQRDQVLFVGNNLPMPGPDSVYRLWAVNGKVATPVGVVADGGDVRQVLTGLADDAEGLAVSIEPASAASSTPTGVLQFAVTF